MRAPALIGMALLGGTLAACSASTPPSSPAPSGAVGAATPTPGGGCVSSDEARQIWQQIDDKLLTLQLDPKHAGASDIATGQALALINDYVKTTLVTPGVTEREQDRLDQLTVASPGCNGGPLRLRISVTVVRDDYLKPDGSLDHSDPAVGTQLHLLETYVRENGVWKQSEVVDLDQPGPSGGTVI